MSKITKLCEKHSKYSESLFEALCREVGERIEGRHIISFVDHMYGSADALTIIELYNNRVVVNTRPSPNITNWCWKTIHIDMCEGIGDLVFKVTHEVSSIRWDKIYFTKRRIFGKQYTLTFDNIKDIIRETYKDRFDQDDDPKEEINQEGESENA